MALGYADAVAALYRSSQEQFVAERKRLATELKANGDKAGAAQLAKLARPPLSAWAVNQLWWQARQAFEALLASAERLRQGERDAAVAHRDALLTLRGRAALLLAEAGHAVTDATLRRVTTTLTALAAGGGFEPDAPGALAADRDPPGFEALGSVTQWSTAQAHASSATSSANIEAARAVPEPQPQPGADAKARGAEAHGAEASGAEASGAEAERSRLAAEVAERARAERDRVTAEAAARAERDRRTAEEERRRAAEEERRRAEERSRRAAERLRLEAERSAASAALQTADRDVARLRGELEAALEQAAQRREALNDVEARLSALGTGQD